MRIKYTFKLERLHLKRTGNIQLRGTKGMDGRGQSILFCLHGYGERAGRRSETLDPGESG